jgi:hypothetical protein
VPDRAAILIALCVAVTTAGAVHVLHADCQTEVGEHTSICTHDHGDHDHHDDSDHDHDRHAPDGLELYRKDVKSPIQPLLAAGWVLATPIPGVSTGVEPILTRETAPRAGPPPTTTCMRTVVLLI